MNFIGQEWGVDFLTSTNNHTREEEQLRVDRVIHHIDQKLKNNCQGLKH